MTHHARKSRQATRFGAVVTSVRTSALRLAASSSTWSFTTSGQKYCTKLSRLFRTLCASFVWAFFFFFSFASSDDSSDGTIASVCGMPCACNERKHNSPHDPGSMDVSADMRSTTKSAQRQASIAGKSAPYGIGRNCTVWRNRKASSSHNGRPCDLASSALLPDTARTPRASPSFSNARTTSHSSASGVRESTAQIRGAPALL